MFVAVETIFLSMKHTAHTALNEKWMKLRKKQSQSDIKPQRREEKKWKVENEKDLSARYDLSMVFGVRLKYYWVSFSLSPSFNEMNEWNNIAYRFQYFNHRERERVVPQLSISYPGEEIFQVAPDERVANLTRYDIGWKPLSTECKKIILSRLKTRSRHSSVPIQCNLFGVAGSILTQSCHASKWTAPTTSTNIINFAIENVSKRSRSRALNYWTTCVIKKWEKIKIAVGYISLRCTGEL